MSTPQLRRPGSARGVYIPTHEHDVIPQGGFTFRCGKCGKTTHCLGNKFIKHRILGRLGPCCAPTREAK